MSSMSAAVRQKRAESWNAISRAALSSTSLAVLTGMLVSAPHSADAADECGAPVGGVVTCSGSNYPAPNGIGYTNSSGLTLTLNNPNLVAVRTGGGQGGVFVGSSVANNNDIVINALLFQSSQSAVLLTNGIGAVNSGRGNAIIRMDTGTVTVNTNNLGNGLISNIANGGNTGNALITLNGGQVINGGGGGGHGVSALNAGTGNATVTMNGGSVQTGTSGSSIALRAAITNAASAGTASVTMNAGTVTASSGIGLSATTSGSGLAQVTVNGGSVSSRSYGAQASSVGGSGNASALMTDGSITVGTIFAAYGLSALADSGSAQTGMSGGTITTNGSSGFGIYAASATGAATASMSGGAVVTNGLSALGVGASVTNAASSAAATVRFSGGSITTNSTGSSGLEARTTGSGAAVIEMSDGTVTANGANGDGLFARSFGTGTYDISVTGGSVTGGSGTGAAIHAAAASGGTIKIGSGATVNAGASGIALSQTGGAATITTAGTVNGNVNLSAAGNTLSIAGGTIAGNISGGGNTALSFDLGTGSFTYDSANAISGMGSVAMNSGSAEIDGSLATNTLAVNGGSLILNGAGTAAGGTTVSGGTLVVGDAAHAVATLTGSLDVLAGGRLQGFGTIIGDVGNAGIIAPGNSIGTLTVSGNYTGNGGTLEIETELGNDTSATDRLVVTGNTSGSTNLKVINVGGGGAQTVEGIKIVDVGGTSNGTFSLLGDYVFQGDQAVVGGAYAYRLYKNGVSTPSDGDWYLRSTLINGSGAGASPLYAPGVPLYESYAGVLQSFNQLGTLQQRTGSRSWTAGDGNIDENASPLGIWGRIETAHSHLEPGTSTTGADYDANIWELETGADGALAESATGALIGGFSVHYGTASADVSSLFGDGDIDTTGYGLGGTLTWYGNSGLYIDAQGQLTWYDSDLHSDDLSRTLTKGNDGFGYAVSIEAGQKISLGTQWSLTPQAQLSYSSVQFDDFTDPYGAAVSLGDGDTLIGRLGLSADYENEWKDARGRASRASVYGIANLYYDFLDGSDVDVSGTRFVSENRALWGGLGLGGAYNWSDERYSINGEAFARTSLQDFGDSYSIGGKVSFNVKW